MNRATAFWTVFGLALLVSAGFVSGLWRWECWIVGGFVIARAVQSKTGIWRSRPTTDAGSIRFVAEQLRRALDDLEPVSERSGVSLNVQWDLVQKAKRAIGNAAQVAEQWRWFL